LPGSIHVSEQIAQRLSHSFTFESRGEIALKGAGTIRTYLLEKPLQ
jgi:class 3 adenylate cyclase